MRWTISVFLVVGLVFSEAPAQEADRKVLPLPREVADLTGKYQAAMARIDEPVKEFVDSYADRLRTLADEAQAKGDLDGVLAVQQELGSLDRISASEASSYEPLAQLQQTYRDHRTRLDGELAPQRVRIESAYAEALRGMVETFTKAGELDAARVAQNAFDVSANRLAEWSSASGNGENDNAQSFDWKELAAVWEAKPFETTSATGGSTELRSRDPDIPEEPALLVGFELWLNPFGDSNETVRGAVPLFRNEVGRTFEGLPRSSNAERGSRRRVTAKDGYVVGGIKTSSERAIRSLSIVFHRLTADGTDPDDSYESKVYGEWEGGTRTEISIGDGLPVGVDGYYGLGLDQLAIIVADP